ncbi:MAG TPA: hypothetical protein VHL10_09845 [Nitrososphaera sp.]|nr:hypothetical protein [Nitrososphaera sp.]
MTPGVHDGIKIPERLYPAFAPLPVPFAQHLVIQEYRRCRRIATRKYSIPPEPLAEVFWQTVLTRVQRARSIVFEVMHPFVLADARNRRRGRDLSFPDSEWLLDMLANYTPAEYEPREFTVDSLKSWAKRGLLTREREYGPFDQTSAASFLVARIAEEVYENKWLPSELAPDEPRFWCYGQSSPDAEVISIPIPRPNDLPPSMILWTPWQGAVWLNEEWHLAGAVACRWSPAQPSEEALAVWDESMVTQIQQALQHIPFGVQAVRDILLVEARKILLERHVFPQGL